ncbi:YaaC family protein [Undibacterium sp.]|uniref:YaaC family protein n=1 Tax=Undibacterium sp. TaxID=1914977 RepID=UPI0025F24007|nr:YaaC family protein [Undibacterium sp.]
MAHVSIKLNGREVKPHKATRSPEFGSLTVLTNNPWEYVALWLQRNNLPNALFYWSQARAFSSASDRLPVESAPLLHYYTFMNATKALLVAKGIPLIEGHGVGKHNILGAATNIDLNNEGVEIKKKGVLPSLSLHLQELELTKRHSMKDLLFNIPCVHRTFCITYHGQDDMFIPLMDCQYVFDPASMQAYLIGKLSADYDDPLFMGRLPATLIPDPGRGSSRDIRSARAVTVSGPTLPTAADVAAITDLNCSLRPDLQYIAGSQTLWYAKANVIGPKRLQRSPLTLMLAAMHRLSELSRYHPMELKQFFAGPQNWLLNEFIQMAPSQFIDEISTEITGHQCMTPNVRSAT